ncbi:MAG TPA: hypothetical protein DIU18_00095 [Gemmatimonadetes bacterium]|nr:hypothetical protein [Gemmatimonadota bacterium]|tara:strand:- start:292 stop:522 length:231 start_codon:yes stop_codon:yes gene_type:complete
MEDQETSEWAVATGKYRRGYHRKISDGIRQGIGVLPAFKEALEDTIFEDRHRSAFFARAGAPLSYASRTGSGGRDP